MFEPFASFLLLIIEVKITVELYLPLTNFKSHDVNGKNLPKRSFFLVPHNYVVFTLCQNSR